MPIKHFDRAIIKNLRGVIEYSMQQALKEYGIKVSLGNARFTPNSVSLKVELATIGENGVVQNPEYEALVNLGNFYGLPESFDINTTVNGYKIVGLNTKSHKYPFRVEKNGKRYKMSAAHLRMEMGLGPKWEQ